MTNEIIKHFIKLGYKYHKDTLGHYFDKGINGQFQLKDKQINLLNDDFVFRWLLLHVN